MRRETQRRGRNAQRGGTERAPAGRGAKRSNGTRVGATDAQRGARTRKRDARGRNGDARGPRRPAPRAPRPARSGGTGAGATLRERAPLASAGAWAPGGAHRGGAAGRGASGDASRGPPRHGTGARDGRAAGRDVGGGGGRTGRGGSANPPPSSRHGTRYAVHRVAVTSLGARCVAVRMRVRFAFRNTRVTFASVAVWSKVIRVPGELVPEVERFLNDWYEANYGPRLGRVQRRRRKVRAAARRVRARKEEVRHDETGGGEAGCGGDS